MKSPRLIGNVGGTGCAVPNRSRRSSIVTGSFAPGFEFNVYYKRRG